MFKVFLIIYGIGVFSGVKLTYCAKKFTKAYKKAEKERDEKLAKMMNEYAEKLKRKWSA